MTDSWATGTVVAEGDTSGAVSITDVGRVSPGEKMRQELMALAKHNKSFGDTATQMAHEVAAKMMANLDDLDAIFAASDKAGNGADDLIGKPLTLTGVDWVPSAERFKTPFGVFGAFHYQDNNGEESTFTTGAGNVVSAGRAFELGNHYPVRVTLAKRTTGEGEMIYFVRA